MAYDGGKSGAGVFHSLINLMPRHTLYIEPFLGNGGILRRKLPAAQSIGIDLDPAALKLWSGREIPHLTLLCTDAFTWLKRTFLESSPKKAMRSRRHPSTATLIYLDPPYLFSTRRRQTRPTYHCELSDHQHRQLLALLLAITRRHPCVMIMISGYPSDMYSQALAGWRTASFQAMTRAGVRATEIVWMNFPPPLELHDYRFLGQNFRAREKLKRRRQRWSARLKSLPHLERLALMHALQELLNSEPVEGLASPPSEIPAESPSCPSC
jgi:hypothetical protein